MTHFRRSKGFLSKLPGRLTLVVLFSSVYPMVPEQEYDKTEVIYGRKHGLALTMVIYEPTTVESNGIGAIWLASGGYRSDYNIILKHEEKGFIDSFLERGFTVFAVLHSSQPRFSAIEMLDDIRRSIRYTRTHAQEYEVDPNRLCISGVSAGGNLALIMATTGTEGDPDAEDPVARASSYVQAVGSFYGPVDFLNYGEPGVVALGVGPYAWIKAPFDFKEFDSESKTYERVTDQERIHELGREISPLYHVSADDPPVLLFHGDRDHNVPIQQSRVLMEKLESVGVPAKLIVREGKGHGWKEVATTEMRILADWFLEQFKKEVTSE